MFRESGQRQVRRRDPLTELNAVESIDLLNESGSLIVKEPADQLSLRTLQRWLDPHDPDDSGPPTEPRSTHPTK